MRLSIVIPCHSRTDLLRGCLAAVARHRPSQTEVIVVDDASPQAAAAAEASRWPGVVVVRREQRGGFCAAVNAGLRAATGAIVELLNDDAEPTAGWAEAALRHFAKPDIVAVAPLVLRWPAGTVIDSAGDVFYLSGVARKRGLGQRLSGVGLRAGPIFSACGCGAFYRRAALQAIGGFPEDFGAYFDDLDVAFRLRWAGGQVWFEPASRVLHHGAASYGRRPSAALLAQQSRNEERLFWRHVPRQLWPRALPQHLAVLAGKAWARWREGTLAPFLAGRLAAWREVPATLRQRRRRDAQAAPLDWSCLNATWPGPAPASVEP
jgi:GT2 family glycosyltransferase